MLVPLVLLAIGAIGAGVLNLPFARSTHVLENWLEPSMFGSETHLAVPGAGLLALALVAVATGVVGILVAGAVYLKGKGDRAKIEQPILEKGWGVDGAYASFMGGPGRKAFELTARFDQVAIDGAVNGVAALVRQSSLQLRKTQSGYLRNYALGISIGAVVLLGLLLSKAAF